MPHTRGPWSVGDTRNFNGMPMTAVWEVPGSPLALVLSLPSSGDANAKLIAASPELLEAATMLLDDLAEATRLMPYVFERLPSVAKARAAIAKARGASPTPEREGAES